MTAFELAETVVLPVCPEIAALKSMHALLDYLSEAGSVGAKSMFVLNNLFAREILKLRDIESALGQKITADLPYDPFIYLKAINEGVPVVLGAPKSPGRGAPGQAERTARSARTATRSPPTRRARRAASSGVARADPRPIARRAVRGPSRSS